MNTRFVLSFSCLPTPITNTLTLPKCQDICAIMAGLACGTDFEKGTAVVQNRNFKKYEKFFNQVLPSLSPPLFSLFAYNSVCPETDTSFPSCTTSGLRTPAGIRS